MAAHGLRLTKRLGQHHLVDEAVAYSIVESVGLSPDDTVIEIGSGLGALTGLLAARARRLVAIEYDRKICKLLESRLSQLHAGPNVEVVCKDILEFDWKTLHEVRVVGAIPYHITSAILVSLSHAREAIRDATLIMQREVAERLTALPATKAYGRLSVLGRYCWCVSVLFGVPPSAFYPQPAVESCCVRLVQRQRPLVAVKNEPLFFEVVKAAFSHRRKTLLNCLIASANWRLSRSELEGILRGLGLSLSARGEALSLEQFAALSDALGSGKRLR